MTTNISFRSPAFYSLDYESDLTAYTTELQQIWENHAFTFIVGGRAQWGNADTTDDLNRVPPLGGPSQVFAGNETDLSRYSAYGYAHWQILDSLRLIGGLSYDWLEYPVNIDTSPISAGE